jgi:hypothetical protein
VLVGPFYFALIGDMDVDESQCVIWSSAGSPPSPPPTSTVCPTCRRRRITAVIVSPATGSGRSRWGAIRSRPAHSPRTGLMGRDFRTP